MSVTNEYQDAIIGSATTHVIQKVDIYESDGLTPFYLDVEFTEGTVSVDQGRDERRTLELTLHADKDLQTYPEGLWYDKIIKVQRGVRTPEQDFYSNLGSFTINAIDRLHFPHTISISCRDFTKKLMVDKFAVPTAFTAGESLENIIRVIALNGGIEKFILPDSGITIDKEFFFDKGTSRWEAIKELATAYSYELYFDVNEYLVMTEMQDPVLSPTIFTFKTGLDGTIASFSKKTNDARLFNHIGVSSESTDTVPIYAEAVNENPNSPTRVEKIGRRFWGYSSAFIETEAQAQQVANDFLKVMALEQFEVGIESLTIPWLEAGYIIKFEDPDPAPTDPDRFLLSSFSIPLGLGTMESTCKRVSVVG